MNDEKMMKEAIKQALKAKEIDEVPIGCVIVKDGWGYYSIKNKKSSIWCI